MRYKMYDTRGRGDSGGMSMAAWMGPKTEDHPTGVYVKHEARPEVGNAMRVGSIGARSYQQQDWWQTTPIVEIVEDTPNKVVFKTRSGSTYTWEVFD